MVIELGSDNVITIKTNSFDEFFSQVMIPSSYVKVFLTHDAAIYLLQAAQRLNKDLFLTEDGDVCLELPHGIVCYQEEPEGLKFYPN